MAGVPSNIVVPFVGVDFDSSKAVEGSAQVPINMLIVGQRLSTGTVAAELPYQPTSVDEVGLKSGFGSMAHRQALYAFKNNTSVPITVVTLDDAATSTAGTHAWTLGGTAAASGEYVTYVGGQRYAVPVAVGDAPTALQALLVTALTTDTNNLPVTASAAAGLLTLVNKNKGVAADDLDVRFNVNRGEVLPAGLTLTTVTKTAGTVDPDIADALAVLGDEWFNVGTQPYTDNTNLNLLEDHLDTANTALNMRDSMFYQALRDTRSNMITFGADTTNRNSEWVVTLPAYGRQQSTFEIAAAKAAQVAVSIQDDPAVPLHRMPLSGISALSITDKWTMSERNQLALNGISTLTDEVGVQTEATVTMSLVNSTGAASTAYRQQNTLFILSHSRYRFVNRINSKYGRAKLATAADNIGPGQTVMTLDTARDEAIAWFKELQRDGWFEPSKAALTQFKNELQVERSTTNPNRINWLTPPDLMNQFIVGSNTIQFRQ